MELSALKKSISGIRRRLEYRLDADEEEQEQPKKKKATGWGTRLPYGLCESMGIDTTGMTPHEAWEAYEGETGKTASDTYKEKAEKGVGKVIDTSKKPDKEEEYKEPDTDWESMDIDTLSAELDKIESVIDTLPEDSILRASLEEERDKMDAIYAKKVSESFAGALATPMDDDYSKLEDYELEDKRAKTEAWLDSEKEELEHAMLFGSEEEIKEKKKTVDQIQQQLNKLYEEYKKRGGSVPESDDKITDLYDEFKSKIHAPTYELKEEYKKRRKKIADEFRYLVNDKHKDIIDGVNGGGYDFENADAKELVDAYMDMSKLTEMHSKIKNELYGYHSGGVTEEEEKERQRRRDEYFNDIDFQEKLFAKIEPKLDSMSVEDLTTFLDRIQNEPFESYYQLSKRVDKVKEAITKKKDKIYEAKASKLKPKIEQAKPTYDSTVLKDYAKKAKPTDVDVAHTTLKKRQECADAYMNYQVNSGAYGYVEGVPKENLWGLNSEELVSLQDNLKTIFDNTDILVNVNGSNVGKILTGHLKNQFETGTSDGSHDITARRKLSHNIFGTGFKVSGEEREKYGYMADKNDFDKTLGSHGPWYGKSGDGSQCAIVLKKDSVANRTTYTFNDSLSGYDDTKHHLCAAGVVNTNPSIEGVSYRWSVAKDIASGKTKNLRDVYPYLGYVEAQIHGLTTAKDIEEIRYKSATDLTADIKKWGKDAQDVIAQNGIKLAYWNFSEKRWSYLTLEEALL